MLCSKPHTLDSLKPSVSFGVVHVDRHVKGTVEVTEAFSHENLVYFRNVLSL